MMTPKALLIPIAAFAVTVTGASAFDKNLLKDAGLSDREIAAFEQAKELHEEGDKEGARNVLQSAGVDMDTMEKVRIALHKERSAEHAAVRTATLANNFGAFMSATAGSPLAEIVTNEEEFALFREAHELIQRGELEAAHTIMDDLGFPLREAGQHDGEGNGMMGKMHASAFQNLSPEMSTALEEARSSGNHEEVERILEGAGIVRPEHGGEGHGPRMF